MDAPITLFQSERRNRNLAESVVNCISEQIASGALSPGDKLPAESALMTALGVSRTVVREAISRLQAGKVVETRHGIGSFVLESRHAQTAIDVAPAATLRDVLTMLELRISLESESAGLAAQRSTPEDLTRMRKALSEIETASHAGNDTVAADLLFHVAIAQATGNRYFVDILAQIGTTLIPRDSIDSATVAQAGPKDYISLVNIEHQSIVDAIARHDVDGARAAMRMHLLKSRERLRGAMKSEPLA